MTNDSPTATGTPVPARRRNGRIPAATVEEARALYEGAGATNTAEIARRVGITPRSVRRLAERGGWSRGADREALVGKIRARVEAEIAEVGRVLDEGRTPDTAEKSARTLASLARTLRELAKFDEDRSRAAGRNGASGDDGPDDVLADPEQLRRDLADRLDRLRREREA